MTQVAWSTTSRAGKPRSPMAGAVADRGWRSHTFADGVRALTLTAPLDVPMAGRLWARVTELQERGCRRLIVDVSGVELDGDSPALLASVLANRPASLASIVVAPPASGLERLLPAAVAVTPSLSDARRQLTTGLARREPARGPGPAGRIPAAERHALAVRQSLRWAERGAREGDYERALAWLTMIERTEGGLPASWQERRRAWLAAWTARAGDEARA